MIETRFQQCFDMFSLTEIIFRLCFNKWFNKLTITLYFPSAHTRPSELYSQVSNKLLLILTCA